MSADPKSSALVLIPPQIPDLGAIAKQIDTFHEILVELNGQAGRAIIKSEADFARGTDLLTLLKTNKDQAETLRKSLKAPIDAFVSMIQGTFNPLKEGFEQADAEVRGKMTAWRREQDAIARAEQERIRQAQEAEALARAAELEKQGKNDAAEAVLEMASAPLPAAQKTEARRGSFGGKASMTVTWTADIVNMRAFLQSVLDGTTNFNLADITVSRTALNNLAKAVKVECEKNGVKIYKNASLTLR
jgi:hypothetical protein